MALIDVECCSFRLKLELTRRKLLSATLITARYALPRLPPRYERASKAVNIE